MKYHVMVAILLAVFVHNAHAKVIEALEDYTVSKAPQEIVDITERVANKMGFTDGYEVVIPTKAAIQLNPWNKFVVYTINPITKNPLILINPEWFSGIPSEQQDFTWPLFFNVSTGPNAVECQDSWVCFCAYFSLADRRLLLAVRKNQIVRTTGMAARCYCASGGNCGRKIIS